MLNSTGRIFDGEVRTKQIFSFSNQWLWTSKLSLGTGVWRFIQSCKYKALRSEDLMKKKVISEVLDCSEPLKPLNQPLSPKPLNLQTPKPSALIPEPPKPQP